MAVAQAYGILSGLACIAASAPVMIPHNVWTGEAIRSISRPVDYRALRLGRAIKARLESHHYMAIQKRTD